MSEQERAGWATLPGRRRGAGRRGRASRPTPLPAAAFYDRTWALPAFTVHSVLAGDPTLHKTSIQQEAIASVSMRLAPGQDADAMSALMEQTLRAACPAGCTLEIEMWPPAQPAWIDPGQPVLRAAFDGIERATGTRPLATRSGGSIPVAAALVGRGIPTILSGFGTDDDNIHSPNERMELRRLEWAIASAREIFLALSRMP